MKNSYRTIREDGQSEQEIKKSRFICSLKRVTSEEEAKAFILALKKEHWKANHNCSAFVIGENNEIQRSSDDGEPSGTAGVPMLDVLKKNELINVVAVVTRYFGGTKLGAGGLIRAYASTVAAALKEIGIVEGTLNQTLYLTIDYPQLGKLQNHLEHQNIHLSSIDYTDKIRVTLMVPETSLPAIEADLTDLLQGQLEITHGPVSYVERPIS
ncbi:YigZ family protein [Enterococcus gallinarum]|uniref:YigZ family protein n=1 Tax=Enterococcus gallinarum TaxID=1353 RepID=UPI0012E24A22|nr:YigZ family protein [Enterococcus gallinarum]MUO32643.1 YigZ family protein [Enterococcus gallinarum]